MKLEDILADSSRFLNQYTGGCGSCPRKLVGFVAPQLKSTKLLVVTKSPVVGGVSQSLKGALRDVGVSDFSHTHVVHCAPPTGVDPKPDEIGCCMNEHVMGEVANYPLVLLVGSTAVNAFFPGHASKVRGNLAYHPDFENSRFYSILSPASGEYDSWKQDLFEQQIDRLGRIYRGETEAPFKRIIGAEFRARYEAFLQETSLLSFDLETDSLESWDPRKKILSMAACAVGKDEVFSIDETDPYWPVALSLTAKYLQDPTKQVLGQNIGFDLVWMEEKERFKCNLKYIHELQTMYFELHGDKFSGLKEFVSTKLDGYRHLVVWPHKEKNLHRLGLYNSEDVMYPSQLFIQDFPKLRPKTRDLSLRVLGPSSLALRRITNAGIHFRSEGWGPLAKEYADLRTAAINRWQAMIPPTVNIRQFVTDTGFSDLEDYIYSVRKYPVLERTEKTGKPKTDDSVIKELIRNHGAKELENCLEIKNLDKRVSTYIKPYPKLVGLDRRIHSSYHNIRTDTSRTSSSDPNMQNNPRNDPKRINQIRWLFGSSPGNKFMDGDFSQIELREAMCLANDPVGMQVYRDRGDIHIQTACSIAQDQPARVEMWSEDPFWKELRYKAKPVNFGCIYGAQWPTLQAYAKDEYGIILSDDEAKRWHAAFFNTYKALQPWHEGEKVKLQENQGYVESATGHVWYYSHWKSKNDSERRHAERQAINMTCQGPAANMMVYLIYLVQQAFAAKGVRMGEEKCAEVVLTVHDQLGWEAIENHAEWSVQIVQECLHVVAEWVKDWFTVPLVLDIKVGTIWDGPKGTYKDV